MQLARYDMDSHNKNPSIPTNTRMNGLRRLSGDRRKASRLRRGRLTLFGRAVRVWAMSADRSRPLCYNLIYDYSR